MVQICAVGNFISLHGSRPLFRFARKSGEIKSKTPSPLKISLRAIFERSEKEPVNRIN
jgi:hypothetical protein